jgi:AcrR family transcriptional regulator
MTPTRRERTESITRLRKQQILAAALNIFSEKGFAQATTAEIARAAGVAEGTIYNYFHSKRELFISVIRDFIINASLLELFQKLPQQDIALTFTQILQNRFDLIESGPMSRLPVLMGEVLRDPELKTLLTSKFFQPILSQLDKTYRAMTGSAGIRSLEPDIIVRAAGGMIIGFIMLRVFEGETSPLNRLPREKVVADVVDILLYGLLNGEEKDGNKP